MKVVIGASIAASELRAVHAYISREQVIIAAAKAVHGLGHPLGASKKECCGGEYDS